jgi:pimeloyl-ACP methyl ester carboxylesterase
MSSQEEQIMIKKGKVKVNDINIYYEIHGEGFPLVMIHGFNANLDWWPPYLIDEVSKNFKTLFFDNRGAGRTDKPDIEYSMKMMADDTVSLMDALNIERAHVLGISMGGYIAQELVLNYPEKVEKLVLCSTTCGGAKAIPIPPEAMQIVMRDREGLSQKEIIQNWIPILFSEDFIKNNSEFIENFIRRALIAPIPPYSSKRQLLGSARSNFARRLKKVNTPTLVLHGNKDIIFPPKNAEILAKLIPEAKTSIFENIGHLIFSETPEKVVKTLFDFLK